MNIVINSVDHAPDDLDDQLPIRGRLVRMLEGSDRSGRSCWLAELATPISWTKDGVTRTISHLLIAARWVGTSIEPGARVPINIAYLMNEALLLSELLDLGARGICGNRNGDGLGVISIDEAPPEIEALTTAAYWRLLPLGWCLRC